MIWLVLGGFVMVGGLLTAGLLLFNGHAQRVHAELKELQWELYKLGRQQGQPMQISADDLHAMRERNS